MTKKNLLEKALIVSATILPFLLLGAILVVAYAPRWWTAKPAYSFLYYYPKDECRSYNLSVRNQQIQQKLVDNCRRSLLDQSNETFPAPANNIIYHYDIHKDSFKEISLEEAKKFKLDSSNKSPDGFAPERKKSGGGGIFFPSYESDNMYLTKNNANFELDLKYTDDRYNKFKLIGWITEE